MPGSPPTRTTEPGTRPPPRTRSMSAIPVGMRGTAAAATSESRTAPEEEEVAKDAEAAPPRGGASAERSSTRVLHAPHSGQRPIHCGLCAPQAVQEKTVAALRAILCGALLRNRDAADD